MRSYVWLVMPVLVMLAACGEAVEKGSQRLPVRPLEVRSASEVLRLDVEVADDEREREIGLMNRTSMAEESGMLFVWKDAAERSFWMHNTLIPLDIIYVRGGKIVRILRGHPMDETSLPSGEPADMVLEVNAGWAARHGVGVGDRVVFPK